MSQTKSESKSTATSGVTMRTKNGRKKLNQEDILKRLSLPADFHLSQELIAKMSISPTFDGPLTRSMQRQSLVSVSHELHANEMVTGNRSRDPIAERARLRQTRDVRQVGQARRGNRLVFY